MNDYLPSALSVGVPYDLFRNLNPVTIKPFYDAFNMRREREIESRASEIDITAWKIGAYVREAIVSSFKASARYPEQPYSITAHKINSMTPKDHADNFREFLKHYKRPDVKGGER